MKTLIVISSSRSHSASAFAALSVNQQLKEYGCETTVIDLRETPLPLFADENRTLPEYLSIVDYVHNADSYVLSTPDFHGSMSGALKNFLDYFWTEFAGKLFGIICASHDKGLTAMDHIRTVIRQCYGWSLPYGVGFSEKFVDRFGTITDQNINNRLSMFARDMFVYGTLISKQRHIDLLHSGDNTFMARFRSNETNM